MELCAIYYKSFKVIKEYIDKKYLLRYHNKKEILFNVQEGNVKNYAQVYVKNSFEAAEIYCRAFGAEITFEVKNDTETAYEHCELSVNGEGFLALSEAANPCDINIIHKMKWETMTFNVFEMGSEESVCNALIF